MSSVRYLGGVLQFATAVGAIGGRQRRSNLRWHLNHGVTLILVAHAHDWVQHAVPWHSLQLPTLRLFTRHPHAQHVDAGLALQLKRHNIAGGKRFVVLIFKVMT